MKFEGKYSLKTIKSRKKKKRKVNPTTYITEIKKLIVHQFRQFTEQTVPVGRKLNIFSGHTATGKST